MIRIKKIPKKERTAEEQEKFTNEILNLWQTYEPSNGATKDAERLILDILKTLFIPNIIMAFMLELKRMNFPILKKLFLTFYVIVVDLASLLIV